MIPTNLPMSWLIYRFLKIILMSKTKINQTDLGMKRATVDQIPFKWSVTIIVFLLALVNFSIFLANLGTLTSLSELQSNTDTKWQKLLYPEWELFMMKNLRRKVSFLAQKSKVDIKLKVIKQYTFPVRRCNQVRDFLLLRLLCVLLANSVRLLR